MMSSHRTRLGSIRAGGGIRTNPLFTGTVGAIAWFGYSAPWKSGEMAEELRVDKGLLIVPGDQTGMDGYFRLGYGGEVNGLHKGLQLMDEWFAEKTQMRAAR